MQVILLIHIFKAYTDNGRGDTNKFQIFLGRI